MSSTAKRGSRIDTAAKRSRQKTADEAIIATKPAPAKATKRTKSTDRAEPKTRKPSASRSPSRSPSRSRARKSSGKQALGAKVTTKKELEAARSKRGASRSRRSPSVTRTKSKSVERKSADRSRNKDIDESTVADLQLKYGSDNVKRNTYFEDEDITSASRYSLRKRVSPAAATPTRTSTSSSINITRRGGQGNKCWLSCGYLKYKQQDVCKIVCATVVLLVALAIINYFHLVDLATIKSSVANLSSTIYTTLITKPLGFCCDTSRAAVDTLKTFVTNTWTRITS